MPNPADPGKTKNKLPFLKGGMVASKFFKKRKSLGLGRTYYAPQQKKTLTSTMAPSVVVAAEASLVGGLMGGDAHTEVRC